MEIKIESPFLFPYQVEAAKSALTKATDDLNRLADYCENSFNEPQVVTNNDNVKGMYDMAVPVVEFSNGGYKIRKIFA